MIYILQHYGIRIIDLNILIIDLPDFIDSIVRQFSYMLLYFFSKGIFQHYIQKLTADQIK